MHRLNPIDAHLLASAIHHAKKRMWRDEFLAIVADEWDNPKTGKPKVKEAHAVTASDKRGGPA